MIPAFNHSEANPDGQEYSTLQYPDGQEYYTLQYPGQEYYTVQYPGQEYFPDSQESGLTAARKISQIRSSSRRDLIVSIGLDWTDH